MQHPVGYQIVDGRAELTSLWALLTNPWLRWQYPHVISGAMITGSMVMAGIGAYYLLARQHELFGRALVRVGVISGVIFACTSLFPTGSLQGETVAHNQPAKIAAMEGVFETRQGAPMAIIGMPDTEKRLLLDPIEVPYALSFLAYGDTRATVVGLNDIPVENQPPVELVYYAYHIMVGLGSIFIAIMTGAALLLWRGRLYTTRVYLWLLMLAMPFPYIANEAGWMVAEVGRQPWVVYGVQRVAEANSTNVSGGMTLFTLLGFMGLYALLGMLYVLLVLRVIAQGPAPSASAPGTASAEAHA
jgi:cytochrome d ubiquinol oxidase subunit I